MQNAERKVFPRRFQLQKGQKTGIIGKIHSFVNKEERMVAEKDFQAGGRLSANHCLAEYIKTAPGIPGTEDDLFS